MWLSGTNHSPVESREVPPPLDWMHRSIDWDADDSSTSSSSSNSWTSPTPVSPISLSPPLSPRNYDDDGLSISIHITADSQDDLLPFAPRLYGQTTHNGSACLLDEAMCAPWMCVFDLDTPLENQSSSSVTTAATNSNNNPLQTALSQSNHGDSLPKLLPRGFIPDDWQEAYYKGLLPCVMEWFNQTTKSQLGQCERRWTGHLPLENSDGGDGDVSRSKGAARGRLRRRRQQRLPGRIRQAFPPDSSKSLSFFHEYASEDNVEVIHRERADAEADSRRRAPASNKSMSITPTAAVAVSVAGNGGTPGNSRKKPSVPVSGPDGDRVQVQTAGADRSALKDLPALRDVPPAKREEMFVMKLQLCSVIFSFDDPTADKRGKDMKRQTLLELVDYVNTPAGQKIFTESIMGDLMAMVSANVCRALPPATDDFDPEEDEPVLEPAWPHLQVAYEFFLRFIVSSEVNAKAAKKYVDQKFCLQLVELFDSEDPRERDYLKTILHRIYGKFMSHRSFIRRAISNVFYRFVYETERHNGIGELLEILGSIINGFAIPLKKEHLQFLVRALIPLHKPKCVSLYHQQLSYCIIQYVEKDADTAIPILNGFFKCWPWSNSGKQVMFLNELEEILELLGADQLAQVSTMLFTNLARCLDSDHFQVVERALFLWNNEHLVNSGCLSRLNAHTVLPIIHGPLHKNSSGHWNATVEGLAQNVLKMYMEYDLSLYDKCSAAYQREEDEAKKRLDALHEKWNAIEKLAIEKRPALVLGYAS